MRTFRSPAGFSLGLASLLTMPLLLAHAPALSHWDLLHFINSKGVPEPVRSRADWEKRRESILAGMQEVMGPLPPRSDAPLDVKVIERVVKPAFVRQKITYASGDGDRVPAYLFLPRNRRGKRPAMVCLHGSGDPSLWEEIRRDPETTAGLLHHPGMGGPHLSYAEELAERGYVTIEPYYPGFGDYQEGGPTPIAWKAFMESGVPWVYKMGYASNTMKGIVNHRRAVDLLASMPEVDAGRIGDIGHSLGGHNALFLAVFDPRVKVVVTSCGFTSFAKYQHGDLTGWSHRGYMPRIATKYGKSPARMPFDFQEVLAAIAPRPIFVNAPVHDDDFDLSGAVDCVRAARAVYEQVFHEPNGITMVNPDCPHDFPPATRKQAYTFLDAHLHP